MLAFVDLLRSNVRQLVLPSLWYVLSQAPKALQPRLDATSDTIADVISRVRLLTSQQITIEQVVKDIGERVSAADMRTIQKQVESVLGIRPEVNEPHLADMMASFARQNSRLVKNVSDRFLDSLETKIDDGARQGLRAEDIAKQIETDFVDDGVDVQTARNRARLIARDQVASFRGDLTRVRQKELGIDSFVWRTSQDERVRKSHAEREGVQFDWNRDFKEQLDEMGLTIDKIDGPPGRPIQCRCTAEPVLGDLFEGLD